MLKSGRISGILINLQRIFNDMISKPHQNKHKNIYSRLVLSVILWIILIGIIFIPPIKETIQPLMINFTSSSLVFWGGIFGFPAIVTELPMIDIFRFPIKILFQNSAFNFFLLAFTLVVFSKWSTKTRIINFLIYFVVIYFLNLMRFYIMGWIGHLHPELFEKIQNLYWNILFVLVLLLMWVISNDRASKQKNSQVASR